MPKEKIAKERQVMGNKLVCPVCGYKQFWTRTTLMNTVGLTLFGMDWANRKAQNYVCDQCGHVLWFLPKK